MSGFIAVAGLHADVAQESRLAVGSRALSHRGDQAALDIFSPGCGAATRFRQQSGYRTETCVHGACAIVFDGLLFNVTELRRAVGLAPETDVSRVLLEGFREFGDAWFQRLQGSFAIMIAGLDSGEVVLARDGFGHRPMYFAHLDRQTWVASEIKAIFSAANHEVILNKDQLHFALGSGFTPGPETMFRGIFKCVPGFVVRIDSSGQQKTTDYFTHTPVVNDDLTQESAKEFILAALEANVGHYLQACPDLSVMLSGGVDSALLAHLATKISGGRTDALSFGASAWSGDESSDARNLADRLGMPFTRSFVSPQDDILGSLRRVIGILEEPTRFENAVALELMMRSPQKKCTALMTGEGADFMLGMREHAVASRLQRILGLPAFVRALFSRLPLQTLPSVTLRGLSNYMQWNSVPDYCLQQSSNCSDLMTGAQLRTENCVLPMLETSFAKWSPQQQYTYVILRGDAHCWIERMEKISAAAGIECFHPFESSELLRFGLQLPDNLHYANGTSKPALRSLAAEIFDDTVAYGAKKQLAAPMSLWLDESTPLREAVLALRNPDSRIREFLHEETMEKYLAIYARDGAAGGGVSVQVFRMLTFELWLEKFA